MLIPISELKEIEREVGPKNDEGRFQTIREGAAKVREGAGWKKSADTVVETVAGRVIYVGKLSNVQRERMGITRQDVDYIVSLESISRAAAGDILKEYPLTWQASTRYYAGERRQPTTPTGRIQLCIAGGESGSSEPAWPGTFDATTADGGILWIDVGKALEYGIMQMMAPTTFGDYISKKALCNLRQL